MSYLVYMFIHLIPKQMAMIAMYAESVTLFKETSLPIKNSNTGRLHFSHVESARSEPSSSSTSVATKSFVTFAVDLRTFRVAQSLPKKRPKP